MAYQTVAKKDYLTAGMMAHAGLKPERIFGCSYPVYCNQSFYTKVDGKFYCLCKNCNVKCSYRKEIR